MKNVFYAIRYDVITLILPVIMPSLERARETGQDYRYDTQILKKTPPQGQLWSDTKSRLDGLFLG
jgi:hypothetical protein|tara:strand:+ start:228 stop:422 length:195 start_codon:yes stop_codon:yes gene_type:complete